jgi:Rrf2 family iron-sulfur cluster assembly transcriptional regulator
MRLSTKGRYAVTAMLTLAMHDAVDTVALADISRCQRISLSYLEQLFAKLRKHQLIAGVRGPGGGYHLAKPLDQISMAQIITAVDEPDEGPIVRRGTEDDQRRLTDEFWEELSGRMYEFLDGITLAEFAERPQVQKFARRLKEQHDREKEKRSAA